MRLSALALAAAFVRCGAEPVDPALLGEWSGFIEIHNECCPSLLFPHRMTTGIVAGRVRLGGLCIDCTGSSYCTGILNQNGTVDLAMNGPRVGDWTGEVACAPIQLTPPNCPPVTITYTSARAEVLHQTLYVGGSGRLLCGAGSQLPPDSFRMSFKSQGL